MKRFAHLRGAVRKPGGAIGALILAFVIFVALAGPHLSSTSPTDTLGIAGALPGDGFPLGTDYLGRDVLARVLHGGASVLLMGTAATGIAYLVGVAIGIAAGYFGGRVDMLLMRAVDIVLAFPPLMVLLLLVGGLSNHIWVLVLGVIIVQVPSISRVSRAAAQTVSKSEFVDAARARGDGVMTIWRRDVLANIMSTVLADFGIRFGISIVLIASMNYLGLGLTPPAADWGLMISENKDFFSLNPNAVLIPALMLALLTIGVNLFADAYIRAVQAGSSHMNVTAVPSSAGALAPTAAPVSTPRPATPEVP